MPRRTNPARLFPSAAVTTARTNLRNALNDKLARKIAAQTLGWGLATRVSTLLSFVS